ncbi:hypothetical protein Mgra_00007526 [Meloidogyne graminicola]|uniref:DUF7808 domain-containing protein n=1 Tax=Meloidogyne graminicola TaxID=189291 RepID=A0A8S9ZIJ4_9BILA|nr:hypothetical protein Mgra_00007526 [Meloidogyne graminicola]
MNYLINNIIIFIIILIFKIILINGQWPRWEERTLDCISKIGECILIAPNSKIKRDPNRYKCRREPMPQTKWNKLAINSTTRIACPIGCEQDADLSVIQKKPIDNKKCQKYYTYGKYRDQKEGEWYLWLTDPCLAKLTTHCRFNDIPFHQENKNNNLTNNILNEESALQIAEKEQRRGRKKKFF